MPKASPVDTAGALLWQVSNRWQASQRAALRPLGLTYTQYVLLASLAAAGARPMSQRALADVASTDPMSTSQVVRALEANGWVTREQDPGDGRAWSLRATRSGTSLSRRAQAAVAQCDQEFFAHLGRGSAPFRAALRVLRDHNA